MKKKLLTISLVLIFTVSLGSLPKTQASPTAVAISKIYNLTEPGTTFLVNVTIIDTAPLQLWYLNITWDPDIIKVSTGDPSVTLRNWNDPHTKYNIYEGPFLNDSRLDEKTIWTVRDVDNEHGIIYGLSSGYMNIGVNPSGNGLLATINFTYVSRGTTTLHISGREGHSWLQDPVSGHGIPHEDWDGLVTEHGPPQIWTEFWFQAVTAVIIIVIVAVAAYIVKKRRR